MRAIIFVSTALALIACQPGPATSDVVDQSGEVRTSGALKPAGVQILTAVQELQADSLRLDLQEWYDSSDLPGFAVSVFNRDKVFFQEGFGYADVATQKAYTPETVQMIASISKTLIGISLMKAVEDELLRLDDPLNQYLPFSVQHPYYPESIISLRHLATHTSGIEDGPNYAKSYVFPEDPVTLNYPPAWKDILPRYQNQEILELDEFLQRIANPEGDWYTPDLFTNFAAGEGIEYSNVGANLLAYAVEQVVEKPFSDFTQELIIDPLGMENTTWELDLVDTAKHSSYYFENGSPIPAYRLLSYPDGGLYSNVEDLTKYLQEVARGQQGDGQILSNESFTELLRMQDTDPERYFGICWDVEEDCCFGHGGNDFGIATMMFYNMEMDQGAILFTNISVETDDLANAFYGLFNQLFQYSFEAE